MEYTFKNSNTDQTEQPNPAGKTKRACRKWNFVKHILNIITIIDPRQNYHSNTPFQILLFWININCKKTLTKFHMIKITYIYMPSIAPEFMFAIKPMFLTEKNHSQWRIYSFFSLKKYWNQKVIQILDLRAFLSTQVFLYKCLDFNGYNLDWMLPSNTDFMSIRDWWIESLNLLDSVSGQQLKAETPRRICFSWGL